MFPLDQENSLNKPENRPIPKAWNYGPRDVSLLRNECLHQIFEQSADAYPNHTAIIFGTTSVSYAEVEARANALAHYLLALGVTKGTGVGLCLEKSVELYVSMLAIMKAGAYYVPLDPSYPPERTSYILKDSQVRVLILTTETHRDGVTSKNIINLDTEDLQIQSLSTKRLTQEEVGVTTNDLAYVLYTSGSTGKPKGVMLEHKGICNLVRASQEIYGITSEDRVYQGMSVSFDFSLEEIWMAFVNGATLIPATSEMAHSAHGLSKLMTDAGITALSCVPTLFTLLNEDIPTLRFINVGGEDCPPSLVTKWWKPGRRIFNTYGPTETTTNATYAECFPDKKIIPINCVNLIYGGGTIHCMTQQQPA